MKVVVAGGAGYIGSVLVPRLIGRGYQVKVYDLLWFGSTLGPDVEVVRRNVMDIQPEELKGVDAVIFIAGLSNDPMAEFSPAQNFIDNTSCPTYLAYAAKRAGVRRFIHGGSCSVYGYTVNELYDESSPAVSDYPYGISKLQGEAGALQMASKDFSVIGLRKGTVSGHSPRMRFDLVVNTMFKTAVKDGIIRVNNPSIWRPVLSIRDAADAYIRALEASLDISGVFNVASGNHTVGEISDIVAEGIREYLGKDPAVHVNNVQDFRNYKVSWQKAANVLAFHPRDTIKDIVKELASNIDRYGDFEDKNFYNIKTFMSLSGTEKGLSS